MGGDVKARQVDYQLMTRPGTLPVQHGAQVFRFPRSLAVLGMVSAILFMVLAWVDPEVLVDPVGRHPVAWIVVACIPLCIAFASAYWWRYSLVVGDTYMSVGSFRRRRFPISDIASINVWIGRGRVAVITFKDGGKIRIQSYLPRFDQLIVLLRERAGLAKPVWE